MKKDETLLNMEVKNRKLLSISNQKKKKKKKESKKKVWFGNGLAFTNDVAWNDGTMKHFN